MRSWIQATFFVRTRAASSSSGKVQKAAVPVTSLEVRSKRRFRLFRRRSDLDDATESTYVPFKLWLFILTAFQPPNSLLLVGLSVQRLLVQYRLQSLSVSVKCDCSFPRIYAPRFSFLSMPTYNLLPMLDALINEEDLRHPPKSAPSPRKADRSKPCMLASYPVTSMHCV